MERKLKAGIILGAEVHGRIINEMPATRAEKITFGHFGKLCTYGLRLASRVFRFHRGGRAGGVCPI